MDFHSDKFKADICETHGINVLDAQNFYQRITRTKDNIYDNKPRLFKPNTYKNSNAEKKFTEASKPFNYQQKTAVPRTRYREKPPICPEEISARQLYHQALDFPKGSILRKQKALNAYEQFRAACCKADRESSIYKRIELRKAMAITLYLADDTQNAAIYTLGAIHLFRSENKDLLSVLEDLVTLANKIVNKNNELKIHTGNILISKPTEVLIHKFLENPSHLNATMLKESIRDDLIPLFPLNNFILPEKDWENTLIAKGKIDNPQKASLLKGLWNFFGGTDQDKITKPKKIQDPILCQQIKQTIANAIPYFYENNYSIFLIFLFNKQSCFKLQRGCYPKEMIDLLIDYGYQAEGIAYLSILITQAILQLRTSLPELNAQGVTLGDLRNYAKGMLHIIISSEFIEEETKDKLEIQNKIALLQCIAMARILLLNVNVSDIKREYDNAVLPYFEMLANVPNGHRLPKSAIESIAHFALACGSPLPTMAEVRVEAAREEKSTPHVSQTPLP